MSESEKPPEIVPAPSRLLTPGQWLYRTAGEALRLAGPAGKEPTSLVQILATTWKRSPQQIQELTEAYRRLSAWSWRVCLLPKDFGILPKTGVYLTFPLRREAAAAACGYPAARVLAGAGSSATNALGRST